MGPCWPRTRSSLPCPSRCLKHRGLLRLQETWEAPWQFPSLALHRAQEPPSPFRKWPWLHKDPVLPSSNDHLLRPPSSSWAWPVATACLQPEEGRRSHGCLEGTLNTHCALEVSKSPSAHGSMCLLQSPLTWQNYMPHPTPIKVRPFWCQVSKIQTGLLTSRPSECSQARAQCSYSLFVLQGTVSFGLRLPQKKNNLMCDKTLWPPAEQGGPIGGTWLQLNKAGLFLAG